MSPHGRKLNKEPSMKRVAQHLNHIAAVVVAVTPLLTSPASAQRPLSEDQLPNSGVVNYAGTFASTNTPDATGDIAIMVDFGAGTVSADLTIPALFAGTPTASGPQHYTPTGTIDSDGGFLVSQNLQPVTDHLIAMSGNFFNGHAKNIEGQFIAVFCVTATSCASFRTRSGTFSATQR
jgi:hypothetical protein